VISKAHFLLVGLGVDYSVFRQRLNETERSHIPIHGYGTANFTRSLLETFESFLPPGTDPAPLSKVSDLAVSIMYHPLEIIEGVKETLEYLALRHTLVVVTKGNIEEQSAKIEASGLKRYFKGIEILQEKTTSIFLQLLATHRWLPAMTWMIGNSPRSDINPALAAGMKAVYIPHPHTWILEHEDPVEHPNLIRLERFSDLRDYL
jgi:putative hydrolase of the HAD superfamily